jgi:hypothetical protein
MDCIVVSPGISGKNSVSAYEQAFSENHEKDHLYH